jgi:hypothetical protein
MGGRYKRSDLWNFNLAFFAKRSPSSLLVLSDTVVIFDCLMLVDLNIILTVADSPLAIGPFALWLLSSGRSTSLGYKIVSSLTRCLR